MYQSRFSIEEKRNLIIKFSKRTETADKFCKRYNLTRSTFYQWRKDLAEERFIALTVKTESTTKTVPCVTFISSPIRVSSNTCVSLDFASGCRLEELRAVVELLYASK